MGAFFLARRSQQGQGGLRDLALGALRRQGFERVQDLSNDAFEVIYCGKQNTTDNSIHRVDAGNFCLSTGSMIYRQRMGAAAAEAVFDDFCRDQIDHSSLFGNFSLVIVRAGECHIFNDAQGVYPLWSDGRDCFSSSLHAMLAVQSKLTLNRNAVYPYVFQEATFGGDSIFEQIQRLPVGMGFHLSSATRRIPGLAQAGAGGSADGASLEQHVHALHGLLSHQFEAIADCFGDNMDSALSGGYDSRLILALCREQGVTPHLHVYGGDSCPDVQVAKALCRGEDIPLSHEDKSHRETVDPAQFAAIVEQNFHAFQGISADGILDNGSDLATRRSRTRGGRLQLNGGGGEVMRNFFYLPDRRYRSRQLLWTFFSRFDPRTCTDAFSEEAYYRHFEQQIAMLLGTGERQLPREQVEYLYAGFRCTYWMGQNNSINNQFGWFLTPFVDYPLAQYAHGIPIGMKDHGRLEAAVIHAVSPALAAYPSDYGHDFAGPVPLKRRLKDQATLQRPTRLRRYAYRLHKFSREDWPYYLGDDYIRAILPRGFEYMSRFFHIDRVVDPQQFKRICTLEYLLQKTNARLPT